MFRGDRKEETHQRRLTMSGFSLEAKGKEIIRGEGVIKYGKSCRRSSKRKTESFLWDLARQMKILGTQRNVALFEG